MEMNKKIAIIGAAGFIGKAFVEHVISAGHLPVSITRTEADLTNPKGCGALAALIDGCDAVVILAALTPKKDLDALQSIERFMDNLQIAHNLIKGLKTISSPKILYVSSDAVYSPELTTLEETSPTDPDNLYGLAHKTRENLFLEIASNSNICIVRPCALFGATDPHNAYGPNRFMREAITHQTITLFGDGEELRNHLYIKDFAHIMLDLIIRNSTGIFNAAPQPAISFLDIAEFIVKILPFPVELNFVKRSTPLQHRIHISNKLLDYLDSVKFTPLETSLELLYKELNFMLEAQELLHVRS